MIDKVIALQEVLENITYCTTKEQCVHEIQSMLQEAERQLWLDTIKMAEHHLADSDQTDEEVAETVEEINNMKHTLGVEC